MYHGEVFRTIQDKPWKRWMWVAGNKQGYAWTLKGARKKAEKALLNAFNQVLTLTIRCPSFINNQFIEIMEMENTVDSEKENSSEFTIEKENSSEFTKK